MAKDSPSPPPAPDYVGAAKQTQQSSMASQYTPYGNQVYSPDSGSPSGYRSDISLTPQAQQALDSQFRLSGGMGSLAERQLGNVNAAYEKPMPIQGVQDVADKAYGAMTSRLDPQWSARQEQFDAQMANQGIPVGSEAYGNANREFQQSKNDAYQQANLGAIQTMPQTYQIGSSIYNQPLNTLNAIRSGAQVQNPQFTPSGPGANILGAAQAGGQYGQGLYNAQVGANNSMMGGLYGLGAAGLLALSDRRLKSNVIKVGEHPKGFGIYEYDILGRRERGVMADEVEKIFPLAVKIHRSGFKMVDYGLINA